MSEIPISAKTSLGSDFNTVKNSTNENGSHRYPNKNAKQNANLESFAQTIRKEFLEGSSIDADLFKATIETCSSLEISPGYDAEAPLHEALGWRYVRFGNRTQENIFGTIFRNENGSVWQAKLSRSFQAGKKPYLAPLDNGSRAYFPAIPAPIRARISAQYGVELPSDGSFWDFIAQHPRIPIVITEGGKKSLCLLSHGYVAIALYGVNSGYSAHDKIGGEKVPKLKPELIPDLLPFLAPARKIVLAFDQDSKSETAHKVVNALKKFGGLLQNAGFQVAIATWNNNDGLAKGVDDLIANRGVESWQDALDSAESLDQWLIVNQLDSALSRKANFTVNTPTLRSIDVSRIPDTGIVALSSCKGSEKTKLIAQLTQDSEKLVSLSALVSLGRNLANSLKAEFWNDLGGVLRDVERLSLCVPSLLAIGNLSKFQDCDLVIDEVTSVTRFLLESSICNKDGKRPLLLAALQELIQGAKRILIADADLDDATLRWVESLRGERAFLLKNEFVPTSYPAIIYDAPDRSAITADLIEDIESLPTGKAIFVMSDSKALVKTLESLITDLAGVGVLALHAESSGGELERQFIQRPNEILPGLIESGVKVVVCSPSITAGLSIEIQGMIERVYGIYQGVSISDGLIAQSLLRVRESVERRIWVAEYGSNYSSVSRSTNSWGFKRELERKTAVSVRLVRSSLQPEITQQIDRYDWQNPHVELFSHFGATQNQSMAQLRARLIARLQREGCQVSITVRGKDDEIKSRLKEHRAIVRLNGATLTQQAPILTHEEVLRLESDIQLKGAISPEDQAALSRYYLAEFYCIQPENLTIDDVLFDSEGRSRSAIRALEALLYPETALDRTVKSIETQLDPIPWDINTAELQRQARVMLGLDELLNQAANGWTWTAEDLKQYADKIRHHAKDVKLALNVSVNDRMSDTQLVHQLLSQLGIKLDAVFYRAEGKRGRRYSLNLDLWQKLNAIVEARHERSERLKQAVSDVAHPPSLTPKIMGGVPEQNSQGSTVSAGFTQEDLADVRQMWIAAPDEQTQQMLKAAFPADLLRMAISA
ncbi:DUF3854 domain-containing protein [Cyanobacteria bacterium FACHB-63]|nr:DUF3854 domain-containing protein [Cyanobacteria bacterium FACHB-63]